MGKTKKSHFIPRTFLKRFCDENGNIFIYDKETKSTKLSGPSDKVFRRNWLYSFYEEDGKGEFVNIHDNEIENTLGLIETNIPSIFNKIDSTKELNLDEKEILRLFCFIQWARTPNAIYISNKSHSNLFKKMSSMILKSSSKDKLKEKFGEDFLKDKIIKTIESENFAIKFDKPSILSLQQSIELFQFTKNIKLEYDIIKTNKILIIGENPTIIKLPMICGVEIVMPISTHQLLYIHSDNIQNKIATTIDALNKVQLDQTEKYVFFKEKPNNFDTLLGFDSDLKFSFPVIKTK
jgi:hypothetical protein